MYMLQPLGFIQSSNQVCKLKKALYGLKQAPRAWYSTFSKVLISQGFVNSHSDSSFFVQHTSINLHILVVYVDDILVIGSDPVLLAQFIQHMHTVFSMKELETVSYFLGISIQALSHGYFLSQTKYATELFHKAGLTDCKPCSTPLTVKTSYSPFSSSSDELPFSNPSLYMSIVGGLQYLTITRPDLALVVNQACQHMHLPTNADFQAVKRLLRYVKGTLHHGLHFTAGPLSLHAFFDSNWAGDGVDRKSTSSYCVYLGSNLISWSAKKQPIVSRSSTEAEYRALANATAELTWLQQLLKDTHIFSIFCS
ncbi:uncharacterized protein LOC114278518 [Camellia sinensis]|uniref:uncharacterized protein LOC114278518 n=1 Tax=Camellia sinensis TaxID=4442 RepID=UPI001035BCF6|nr:uncharacterized protein LOC114278518 [Camellia sinensis]